MSQANFDVQFDRLLKGERTITLDELEDCDDLMMGICVACGETRESCEPDADGYECESCNEKAVLGTHWWVIAGKVRD